MDERKLLKKLKSYKRLFLITIILYLFLIIYLLQNSYHHWGLTIGFIVITFVCFSLAAKQRKEYKHHYRELTYKVGMEHIFSNVNVNYMPPYFHNIVSYIEESNLKYIDINKERISPVSYIQASYQGMQFVFSEYKRIERKSESNIRYEGMFLSVVLPENFIGEVQIHASSDVSYRSRLQKIQFEDIKFNKTLQVYATSQKDAFRIITPKILLLLQDIFKSRKEIDCCFMNGTFRVVDENSTTYIYVPFFKRFNRKKAEIKMQDIVDWIIENIEDYKLQSIVYTTGRR